MLKHTLVLIAVLSLAVVTRTTLHAQTTDFSGTWTLDQEASQFPQPPGGGGGRGGGRQGGGRGGLGAGATIVITQTETVLSMEQQAGGQSRTVVYRLDGSESTSVAGRGEMTTTSRWDGAALVTEAITITPYVFGVPEEIQASVNSEEVDQVLWVPLPVLLDPKTRGTTTILLPEGPADFPCYWVDGHAVWGLTFRILTELARLAGGI